MICIASRSDPQPAILDDFSCCTIAQVVHDMRRGDVTHTLQWR